MTQWYLLLLALPFIVRAQIRIISPPPLIKELGNSKIQGSTTTIGAPFYGDRVLGRLVYGDSKGNAHCDKDDYRLPPPMTASHGNSGYDEARLIDIVIVRRGNCSFAEKVAVAYEKGAHAVIIVDKQDSTYSSRDMANVIVSEDGWATDVHIPSVFISKEQGAKLINAAKHELVVVELVWEVPPTDVVQMDLWMSSTSEFSLKFLKEFAPKRKELNQVINFQPHYEVFSMQGSGFLANGLCHDSHGKYCAEDPDGSSGAVKGRDVLDEDVRQLCIHDLYKVATDGGKSKQTVQYSQQWWDYMEKFTDECPINGGSQKPDHTFGIVCSERVMSMVGINVNRVRQCVDETAEQKLQHELQTRGWSPRALRINGWRYSGILDADLVAHAVCAGFIIQPEECDRLLKPRDHKRNFVPLRQAAGVGWLTFILSVAGAVLLLFSLMTFYKRYLSETLRISVREEVMLEVKSQMDEHYTKMRG